MQRYLCLIIEDEPLAAEVLQDYIRQVPFLELKGVASDAIFAMELMQQQKVDPDLPGYPPAQTERV